MLTITMTLIQMDAIAWPSGSFKLYFYRDTSNYYLKHLEILSKKKGKFDDKWPMDREFHTVRHLDIAWND